EIGKPTVSSPLYAQAKEFAESSEYGPGARGRFYGALARMHENSGDYVGAFEHFQKSNAILNVSFDVANYRQWVSRVIEIFTPEFLAKRRDFGHPSDVPVFVVGMPRSGTTLTEQIIAAHPKAGGAGELIRMHRFADRFGFRKNIGAFAAALDRYGKE